MNLRVIYILFILFAASACGGGGGGGGTSSSSSAATAYDWTTSGTSGGSTATVSLTTSGVSTDGGKLCMPSTNSCWMGGVDVAVNASTDAITINFEGTGPDFSTYVFNASDIKSTSTATSDHTLGSTNYTYNNYSVANSRYEEIVVLVPSNYSYMYQVYWDNLNNGNVTTAYLNIGVLGSSYTGFSNLPSSGTASYTGGTEFFYASSGGTSGSIYTIEGDASFSVDWANKQISGAFTNLDGSNSNNQNVTFPNITMNAANIIEDTTYVNGSNENLAYFEGNLEFSGYDTFSYYNKIWGHFMGPAYNEIGGTFELTASSGADGGGYFAVKR